MKLIYKSIVIIIIGIVILFLSYINIERNIVSVNNDDVSSASKNNNELQRSSDMDIQRLVNINSARPNFNSNEKIFTTKKDSFNANLDEKNLYLALETAFLSLAPEETINIKFQFDLSIIANCSSCIQLIQNQLQFGTLTTDQLQQIAEWLSQKNHPELAVMLADTVGKIMNRDGFNKRSEVLIPSITKFDSIDIARQFTDYLLTNPETPFELEDAIIKTINNTTEREQVAASIFDRFTVTAVPSERDRLLSIGQPESLIKIAIMGMEQGNEDLYNKASDYLSRSPSQFTFDALLNIAQSQAYDISRQSNIIESAKQWAYRQLSGSRLDVIEERLGGDSLSEQDKQVTLQMLQHGEDQIRSREIVAKYFENN